MKNIHGDEYLIESYHEDGSISERLEWNHDRTKTFLVERYNKYGKLTEKRIWNEARTSTFKVD
jgi:hypothetical protein